MSGQATYIEITYLCEDCGEEYKVGHGVTSNMDQITLPLQEEHEDCEVE